MNIKIPYGKDDKINLSVPEKNVADILEPNDVPVFDESSILHNAFENPVNSQNLKSFLIGSNELLIIINDATRPTPTAKVLDIIYNDISTYNFKFIVATGTHRPPTENEYQQIFGKYFKEVRDKVIVHNSNNHKDMIFIGISRNGTEMLVNRLAIDSDKIIAIGSVEPHYFGGYTGGRKSFLPGIAAFKTIEQNHKFAIRSGAKNLVLEGNPLHEDMVDFVEPIKHKIFTVSMVLDRNQRIYAATTGHIHDSFKKAVEKVNEVCVIKIREKADIVVSVIKYPMDIDLYQSHKGIENTKTALNNNGILILVSKCRFGIGKQAFVDLAGSYESVSDLYEKIENEYELGYHKVGKLAELNQWAQVWAVTDLDPEIPRKVFMKPFKSLQEAIDKAIELKGENAKILFFMDASVSVPVIDH